MDGCRGHCLGAEGSQDGAAFADVGDGDSHCRVVEGTHDAAALSSGRLGYHAEAFQDGGAASLDDKAFPDGAEGTRAHFLQRHLAVGAEVSEARAEGYAPPPPESL
eukprot:TRINITY_DN14_c0_g3_i1.p3 TRINITY_DN14_c0_g3~~TRINITY_DN14_c0_g3_i1.p3  ORF type:complete len:106 (+),score=18.85 TRINITY_DN14_c0_g3_i1:432-749(+)